MKNCEGYRCPKCGKILWFENCSHCVLFSKYIPKGIYIPNIICDKCRVYILDSIFAKQIIRFFISRGKDLYGDRQFQNRKKEISRRVKIMYQKYLSGVLEDRRDELGYKISRQRKRVINPE